MQIKTLFEDTRNQLQTSKNAHLRQIEMMEGEELIAQKRSRAEMIQMEDVMSQIRKEYEMLRIEFEQNMAANEQTAPINREMRHLITSLQNHNGQLKGEVYRYKRKYKEVSNDNVKMRKELDEALAKLTEIATKSQQDADVKQEGGLNIKEESSESSTTVKEESGSSGSSAIKSETEDNDEDNKDKVGGVKQEKTGDGDVKKEGAAAVPLKKELDPKEVQKLKEAKMAETEIRDLKAQLKKAMNDQKEMKLLLDMYKGVSKDQRDKVQLMATEKKLRAEIEDLRNQLKKMQESKREDRKKLADEEALRKIKQLEEQKYELQKQVANQKPQIEGGTWTTYPGGGGRPFVGSHVSTQSLCRLFSKIVFLTFAAFPGRRSTSQRNGSDWSSVRRYARTKFSSNSAATRKR
jgi:E3 ubiquitin-protein ligase BRE1